MLSSSSFFPIFILDVLVCSRYDDRDLLPSLSLPLSLTTLPLGVTHVRGKRVGLGGRGNLFLDKKKTSLQRKNFSFLLSPTFFFLSLKKGICE